MLVYFEYFNTVRISDACLQRIFNAGVSIYISHITIFTFATCTPPFDKYYQILPSSSSIAMLFNRHFAIPVDKVVELVDQLTSFQCVIEQLE